MNRRGETALGKRGKVVADTHIFDRNGQQPAIGRVAEDVTGQRQHGRRVGGVGHDLGSLGGDQFAELNLAGSIHGGIDKDDGFGLGDRVGEFGGQEGAGKDADAGEVERGDSIGHFWADAVIAAKGVAVAEYEEAVRLAVWSRAQHGVEVK